MIEQRFLAGGLDSDTAPHNMEKDSLLNAVNVRTVISKTQNSTNIQLINGNVNCDTFNSDSWTKALAYSAYQPLTPPLVYQYGLAPRYVEKGKCVDGTDIYYFLQDYNKTPIHITGATNASSGNPIVITTATLHHLANAELVGICGVLVNTNANGYHYAHVLSPTTFALYSDAALTNPISGNGVANITDAYLYPPPFSYFKSPMVYTVPIPHESRIVKYDTLTGTATIILSEYWVDWGAGLTLTNQWGAVDFIDCGISDGKLFWVDSIPRYIDLSINYLTEYTTGTLPDYANGYTNTLVPFSVDLLSLVTEPSIVPLVNSRVTDATISSLIQFKALQFCVRFTNQSGFYSVLSPYSLTSLPVRQDEILANVASYHNTVTVTLPSIQKIPLNWQTVEYIVRDLETNSFYCFATWNRDNAADVAAVNAHNDTISPSPLTFTGYYGINKYAIDSGSIAKQFDAVPLSATSMALVANRLLIGGIVEGYNTDNEGDSFIALSPTTYTTTSTPVVSGGSAIQVNVLTVGRAQVVGGQTSLDVQVLYVRWNSNNWFLPLYYSAINYGSDWNNAQSNKILRPIRPPKNISKNSLTISATQDIIPSGYGDVTSSPYVGYCVDMVNEAFGQELFTTATPYLYCNLNKFGLINILDVAYSDSNTGHYKCFAPNASYKLGLQFYDEALRKSGVRDYENISIDPYGSVAKTLTESFGITIANTSPNPVPDWAKYFSITLSGQQKSAKTISFVPPLIQVVIKNDNGDYYYGGYDFLTTPLATYSVYGISVPFKEMVKYGYGYDYKQGDFIELIGVSGGVDTGVIRGNVIDYLSGNIIISYDSSKYTDYATIIGSSGNAISYVNIAPYEAYFAIGGTNAQDKVVCTLYMDTADIKEYEMAKFGRCANGQFVDFFDNPSFLTASFEGDHYLQARNSSAGALTCPSYTNNEQFSKFPITNLGRLCAEDRIGQKSLQTAIRWSNTFIPSAQTNGYSSFDALDIKVLEPTAEQIVRLVPTTKGVTEGSQMLVVCTGGSFTTLVGKAQLFGANQQTSNIVSTTDVLGEVNPLQGNWTCNSPQAVVTYQGLTFWPDSRNRDIIQFGINGAVPVSSKNNCSRLFRELFSQYNDNYDYHIRQIRGAVNPYTNEYMIGFHAADPYTAPEKLKTTTLDYPFDCYTPKQVTYIYNWNINKWICHWETFAYMVNVGDDVYSIGRDGVQGYPNQWSNTLWKEFYGTAGNYYGVPHDALIAIPFNQEYPIVKAPLAIRGDMTRHPDTVWVEADSMTPLNGSTVGVANTQSWKMREGDAMATILRDRRSKGDVSGNYQSAGISGNRLKGKVVKACLIWSGSNSEPFVTCGSVGLEYEKSSGHS